MFRARRPDAIVSELSDADLAAALDRGPAPQTARARIKRLRESHDIVAQLMAEGYTNVEISQATGYHVNRISMFRSDPAMQERVALYMAENREARKSALDRYNENLVQTRNRALRMLNDKMDDYEQSDELPSLRDLANLNADLADRTGYGKKSTTNVVMDDSWIARLDRAIEIRNELASPAPPKLIEARAVEVPRPNPPPPPTSLSEARLIRDLAPEPRLRRRI